MNRGFSYGPSIADVSRWRRQVTSDSPCQNNATCHNSADYLTYTCDCTDQYTGLNCETFIQCTGEPCQNGAPCTDSADYSDYSCACSSEYTGKDCDVFIRGMWTCLFSIIMRNAPWIWNYCLSSETEAVGRYCGSNLMSSHKSVTKQKVRKIHWFGWKYAYNRY